MNTNVNEQVKSSMLEGFGKRKAMFVPMVCVSSFMLVGYAALDREAPEIITKNIDLPLGEELDLDAIEVIDNRDARDAIKVVVSQGNLDPTKIDSYTIEVTAIDSFNNASNPTKIQVNYIDDEAPEFVAKENVEGFYTDGNLNYLRVGSDPDLKKYISAIDNDPSNPDVTEFMDVLEGIDTNKLGPAYATFRASDDSGNSTTNQVAFYIIDDVKPELQFKQGTDAKINYGSQFNITDFVNAVDNYDGAIDDKMEIEGSIDTNKIGEKQTIKISVKDNSGNETSAELTLTVADTEAPKISLSKTNITVQMGEVVNLSDYVTVSDNYDQDIANKVSYGGSPTIDTSTEGTQYITISVTDEAGNVSTADISVRVYDPNTYAGSEIVSLAYSKVGCAYVYGGNGPYVFDCSGFTQWLYAQVGISIPRTATTQFYAGTPVDFDELQPGDLLFFDTFGGISHVGVYVGGGKMVHAGTEETGVNVADINSAYWTACYLGARRY